MFKFIDWPNEKIISWNEKEIRSIFSNKWMVISGIIFSAIFLPIVPIRVLWPTEAITPNGLLSIRISLLSIYFAVTFLAGGVVYSMVRISMMVYRLGKINEIKVSIYQHPVTSVRAIGKLMSRLAFTILIIYIFGTPYYIACKQSIPMMFINIFFGIFVLGFFIYPQMNVHKMMAKMKHKKLMKFSSYLEDSLQAVTEDPTVNNIQRVREMFEIQRSLNGMGEWPFNTKLLLTIITGIGIPILIVLIQIICSYLRNNR
jgi:hypothetical protein